MRLVSRSVVRELWPPFLLGSAAYTFILLIRTVYFLADFFVRRSASFGEVVSLAVLSLPWIVVLTLPMAFLLGVLIGIGRLAGDSEIVALRSCGVGPLAIYRPALAAAAVLSAGVFLLYNFILPGATERLSRSLARVAAKDNPTIANLEQRASQLREQLHDMQQRFTPQYLDLDPAIKATRAEANNPATSSPSATIVSNCAAALTSTSVPTFGTAAT